VDADEPTRCICPLLAEQLLAAMEDVFGSDRQRIDHTRRVLGYAEDILDAQPGPSPEVVVAAAILHDIGIHAAKARHGSSAGPYQEIEGPPIAREIMEVLSIDAGTVEHVCRIIANHHSAADCDTPEFRVIWDADNIVNMAKIADKADRARAIKHIAMVFKTSAGKRLAEQVYRLG